MSKTQTEDEIRRESHRSMGAELGELHFLLWRELASLHLTWREYRSLFADIQEKFDLMNATAPQSFKRLKASMWHDVLLHLCRLTDPQNSVGKRGKPNLTVMQLATKIDDAKLRGEVESLALEAQGKTEFARDWRNRHLAHRDLHRAKSPQVHQLAPASRAHVEEALAALRAVVNHIQLYYQGSETPYENTLPGPGGVAALFYFLKQALEAEKTKRRNLSAISGQ